MPTYLCSVTPRSFLYSMGVVPKVYWKFLRFISTNRYCSIHAISKFYFRGRFFHFRVFDLRLAFPYKTRPGPRTIKFSISSFWLADNFFQSIIMLKNDCNINVHWKKLFKRFDRWMGKNVYKDEIKLKKFEYYSFKQNASLRTFRF